MRTPDHLEHFHTLATTYGLVPASEIRLCFGLRHDLSNITPAFESAAADDDWVRAAQLLNGSISAYEQFGRVIEGLSLLDRAVERIEHIDGVLGEHLRAQSLNSLVTVDDFAQAQRNAIQISDSSVPYLRVIGRCFHGWAVSYSQPDRSKQLMAEADEELDRARAESPGRNTEIAAVMNSLYRAGHLCVDLEYERALADGVEALDIEERIDYAATAFAPEIVGAMILAVIGRPDESIAMLDRTDAAIMDAVQMAPGDFLRVLATIERGDIDLGRDLIRPLAVRGLSQRYAYEANDCVVVLAALALREGNGGIAQDLVLSAGTGSGWSVITADHLAHRLDLVDQRRDRILESIRSRNTAHNTRQAADASRHELDRRGWLEPLYASAS